MDLHQPHFFKHLCSFEPALPSFDCLKFSRLESVETSSAARKAFSQTDCSLALTNSTRFESAKLATVQIDNQKNPRSTQRKTICIKLNQCTFRTNLLEKKQISTDFNKAWLTAFERCCVGPILARLKFG